MAEILKPKPAVLEGMELKWRNFEGRPDTFNAEGDRNFSLVLSDEQAAQMAADGWNVKEKAPNEEYEETDPTYTLKVKVSYRLRAPKIILITYPEGPDGPKNMTPLDESMITMLDWADITDVDLIITSSVYEVRGEKGISCYLQSLYVTILLDPLELKHGDVAALGGTVVEGDVGIPELS